MTQAVVSSQGHILWRLLDKYRLFFLALLTLYLEMALIRYTSAEVLYLGYFSNFVLISAFLGIGLGFLSASKKIDLFFYVPQTVLLLCAYILVSHVDMSWVRDNAGQIFFGVEPTDMRVPLWFSLVFLFAMTTFLFTCVAQETARCFQRYTPLVAYSIDIAGSLAGIGLFTLHSFLGAPPLTWFGVVAVLALVFNRRGGFLSAALAGCGVVLLFAASVPQHYVRWSPYQKIETKPSRDAQGNPLYMIMANGIPHQAMLQVNMQNAASVYAFPYQEVQRARGNRPYQKVLVIGAGSGTDVAYALRNGAQQVDAVEIDPEIYRAGLRYHPEKPYHDPRVTVHLTDGRAFLESAPGPYDLIVYALPDSLASYSNSANVRLESFLFTQESFSEARRLLGDDGVLVLYNYYRRTWLMDKLASMLAQCFGHNPMRKAVTGEKKGLLSALAIGPRLKGEFVPPKMRPATDDWPFLYMKEATLPPIYILALLLFVVSAVFGVLLVGGGRLAQFKMVDHAPFFFMGAAFLLLETKSVVQFALLFGSTWVVNSMVFAAVLASVLIANLIVGKFSLIRINWLAGALIASLLLHLVLPLDLFLQIETLVLRYLLASIYLFAPIFVANLLFGTIFRDTKQSAAAFGWNIIGTMIGGACEYGSLVVGYRGLTVVLLVFYGIAIYFLYAQASNNGASRSGSEVAEIGGSS